MTSTAAKRHIRFRNMTDKGSSLPRRSAPEIIKKIGTAVFTMNGTAIYKGSHAEDMLFRYRENPLVDVWVNITSQMHNIRRNSIWTAFFRTVQGVACSSVFIGMFVLWHSFRWLLYRIESFLSYHEFSRSLSAILFSAHSINSGNTAHDKVSAIKLAIQIPF